MNVLYQPRGRAREYGEWAVNLYQGLCPHRCSYCYVPSALRMSRGDWEKTECKPRQGILEKLEKDLERFPSGDYDGRKPQIFLCFLGDPYPAGIDSMVTREAIQLIHAHGFGVQLLTKGGKDAMRDFDLLGPADAFGATLTFDNAKDSAAWESGAAIPDDRMIALLEAFRQEIPTWASLEPVIKPEQTLSLIRQTRYFVDHYKIGTWNHDARAKEIDWPKFGREVVALLDASPLQSYYLKADLRARMEP